MYVLNQLTLIAVLLRLVWSQAAIDVEKLPVECGEELDRPALEQMRMLAGRLLRRKPAEV